MSLTTMVSSALGKWTDRYTAQTSARETTFPDVSQAPLDSRRLIRDRRYCQILARHSELEFDELSIQIAWRALQHEMASIPGGSVQLHVDELIEEDRRYHLSSTSIREVVVEPFFIDRDCVTNADFAKFVQAGGYELPQFWPQDIFPLSPQFIDRTGRSGPRLWSNSKPPADKAEHPVVGICWYEANAYASWVGKRLPTSTEWQRTGTWPQCYVHGGAEQRYPWGNAFERSHANIWSHEHCDTVAVSARDAGNTPNGVRQLIGNVWEWVDTQYRPASEGVAAVILPEPMAEVRGGAFDTYFASQASCQFRTGQPVLSRPINVGFRCCVSPKEIHLPTPQEAEEVNK